ncbi:MAG: hypothetical protein BMS9Abin37_2629 [Acidobacteriota bacterium]|nr:MAG: hypothetical protein BMS9Abin37_2629 [Acidobacteriota bacterium]
MNTPAHAVVNLLLLGKRDRPSLFAPIAFGAILPDLPMFLFYVYQKVWLGTPEHTIWSESYYLTVWQAFFDVFNSLPLMVLAALVAYAAKSPRVVAVFASMMLHAVCDLLLHHNDAHRHFFPFLEWRFFSPVSYWDPRYYGSIVSSIETVVVVVGASWLLKQYPAKGARGFLGFILASYVLYIAYAFVVWV